MTRRHSALALLTFALALAACKKDEPPARPAAVATKAPDPWFVDATSQCQFDSTATHADPEALVREFVARDEKGAFFARDAWLASAVECPGREPGADSYAIVLAAQVVPISTIGDSARVGVRYHLIGTADANGFRPDMRKVTDTLKVNRTRFGWRLSTPVPVPHVHFDVAKQRQVFTRADQWALDAALTQAQRLAPKP